MAISRDLFLSILALDSYNRGYNAGITMVGDDAPQTKLGTATILQSNGTADSVWKGFYGIAYNWNGEKVISYRGADNPDKLNDPVSGANDILNGWVAGLGYTSASQLGMAADFYKSVTGSASVYTRNNNVTLTGHSLGGGLAGYVS
jgi:hypothetical protein